jgi:hypothetical protein
LRRRSCGAIGKRSRRIREQSFNHMVDFLKEATYIQPHG